MNERRRHIYLDYNASAPLRAEAYEAVCAALAEVGNASSVHGPGRRAHGRIETAREQVASLVGARPKNVIFTSGGTEANVTALTPRWLKGGKPHALTRAFVSAIEHPSVLAGGCFPADLVEQLPTKADGMVDVETLLARVKAELDAGGRPLVAVMAANSETGVIQPVAEIGAALAGTDAVFHVDAVQAAGRLDVDIAAWQADSLSLSAHKIGGPQGVGALVLGHGDFRPAPLLTGGAQEDRRRAGTENVAGIAGFGAAAEVALRECEKFTALGGEMAFLVAGLRLIWPDTVVFGESAARLPNTCSFAVPGIAAETALIALDLEGVAVSSGHACSSGKVSASHVLKAMGVEEELARGALRVSSGWGTTRADIEGFLAAWRKVSGRLRPVGAGEAA
ncbi:cysteine desulfurase [Stappia sp. F7233]|uniref:Cysteine desulfurase n=1 Tax=Stappia albiluteola TaxID=2758565 RepID=A0A839ABX3_9HYPH|nr:cysteine desulfurase family protein [Stappia albiluteola]MBA5776931.1 cysteine desulfurase [Stappia albiluteola]